MLLSTNNNTSESMSQASSSHDVKNSNVTSFDRQFLHWSFIVLEVAAILTIVVGDISMLMLFFTRKLLGQSTNILVFSVAIGDLVNGLLTFPLAMLQKILTEPSEFMCKGYFYFANVSKTAVSYTILLLAMERIAAVLNCTYRILPPGRCLFFASLTWFFSAAYNIWSVVIYDLETVHVITHTTSTSTRQPPKGFYSICFASRRFMYLHEIFEYLNPLVTFGFPVVSSSVLFLGFWLKRQSGDKPGRPYKSSKSVVIFTFALLVSFLVTHFPWEVANLVFVHDAPTHTIRELIVLKTLHILTFSRGFFDIFIFGAFRRYVCKKEKALAHFREQRSLQVQRSSLSIPINDQPAASLSLLDSDPSVSRRYSSDVTMSRRPSAVDGISVCDDGIEDNQNQNSHAIVTGRQEHNLHLKHHGIQLTEFPQRRKSTTITTTIISENYLIPRSPCLHEHSRRFSFIPAAIFPPHNLSGTTEECRFSNSNDKTNNDNIQNKNGAEDDEKISSLGSAILSTPEVEQKDGLIKITGLCDNQTVPATSTSTPTISVFMSPSSLPSSTPSSSISLSPVPPPQSITVTSTSTNFPTTSTIHINTTHEPTTPPSSSSIPTLSFSLPPSSSSSSSYQNSLRVIDKKRKKSCSFKETDTPNTDSKNGSNKMGLVGDSHQNVVVPTSDKVETVRKLSLFLETTFDLTFTSPTTIAAITRDDVITTSTLCENDL